MKPRSSWRCSVHPKPANRFWTPVLLQAGKQPRWRRRESDLPRFRAAQVAMLRHAAEAVKPGGRVVYSTCSSEPEENDQVVEAFLRESPSRFTSVDLRGHLPGLDPVLDEAGVLR